MLLVSSSPSLPLPENELKIHFVCSYRGVLHRPGGLYHGVLVLRVSSMLFVYAGGGGMCVLMCLCVMKENCVDGGSGMTA